MTPAQQAALEALAGRSLTAGEVEQIVPLVATRDDAAIAAILSNNADGTPRTRPRKTEIGTGTILAAFQGLGGQFIDTLRTIGQTNRDIHWLIEGTILRGVLDTSDPATRAGVQGLIAQQSMAAFVPGMQALLALGVEADPITAQQVDAALSLIPVTTWTGEVTGTQVRDGMVHVTITYTSSAGATRVERTFADDLTPARVAQIIAARVESLQRADAALAQFPQG